MNKSDILEYLKSNQDARGIAHWKNHEEKSGALKSCGIGLTKLRKFSKTVGKDPKLAPATLGSKDLRDEDYLLAYR